jgi:hypothetical protein
MWLTVGDHLAIEVGHLLHKVVIMEQYRAIRAYCKRVLITGYRNSGIIRGGPGVIFFHSCSFSAFELQTDFS